MILKVPVQQYITIPLQVKVLNSNFSQSTNELTAKRASKVSIVCVTDILINITLTHQCMSSILLLSRF